MFQIPGSGSLVVPRAVSATHRRFISVGSSLRLLTSRSQDADSCRWRSLICRCTLRAHLFPKCPRGRRPSLFPSQARLRRCAPRGAPEPKCIRPSRGRHLGGGAPRAKETRKKCTKGLRRPLRLKPCHCGVRVYSSGVERLTADQQVPGSNPGAPLSRLSAHAGIRTGNISRRIDRNVPISARD